MDVVAVQDRLASGVVLVLMTLPFATRVLESARARRAFSAVSAEVGRVSGALWTHAAGTLGFDAGSAVVDCNTVFDLASLTKVLATTTCALVAYDRQQLDLEAPVSSFITQWTHPDRSRVTIRDLLEHCSGLPAHRDYFRHLSGREAYLRAIAHEPLEYSPRSQSIYSDLGFIALGCSMEQLAGRSLDTQFADWRAEAAIAEPLTYLPAAEWASRTAQTEIDPWRGRLLQGEVHDENAAALGGVAAHSGLFGTAAAVGAAARWWLALLRGADDRSTGVDAAAARLFVQRSSVPGSSRALGWDTMLPTSSCGTRLSASSVGHTGFTGTSLWLDPERDLYFVLLTNRVHPTRHRNDIQPVRRAFHDAAMTDLDYGTRDD
jgi:serine-type D-Ala-D-Ala carboxypeptidase